MAQHNTEATGQAGLVLGHEGVGDALHAVHGTDEGDGGAPADDQAEMSGVLGHCLPPSSCDGDTGAEIRELITRSCSNL